MSSTTEQSPAGVFDLTARVITERVRGRLFAGASEPIRVGRYEVLDRLGQGAMGGVFGARDVTLHRNIALKLVHPHRARTALARQRMLREAQAMARVSHPNVVHVYEAGEHEGQVFIAMELVEGSTLSEWLAARDRGWREIVALFVEIARGLSAAHAAGVVHRDFKPDNVLVTAGGLAKVADFGLAQLHDMAPMSTPLDGSEVTDASLTATGAVMGTPRYRSPEQHAGQLADARSDQFSFCVALYEALFHKPPFAGRTVGELCDTVRSGRMQATPLGVVPTRVRAAVLRGLSVDPQDRHASMDALVAILARDPWTQRSARVMIACGGITVAAGAWLVSLERGPTPCQATAENLSSTWTAERRERVVATLSDIPVRYAADTAARVGHALDSYRHDWLSAYREACEATRVHGHQSEARMDRRIACLERRRAAYDAVAEVLERADAEYLPRATQAVLTLPGIERCADPEYLDALVPPPEDPALREQIAEIERANARAHAALRAGMYAEALQLATQAERRAALLGAQHLRSDALYALGRYHLEQGEHELAVPILMTTYHAADEVGDDAQRVAAARDIVFIASQDEVADPEAWMEHARSALRRSGSHPALEASLRGTLSTLYGTRGRHDEALVEADEALRLFREAGSGPSHAISLAAAHNSRGDALRLLGRVEEAASAYRESATVLAQALGPEHPRTGLARDNLGGTLRDLGRAEEALVEHRAAAEILEAAFGADHPTAMMSRANLGSALADLGRVEEALALHRQTLAVMVRVFGGQHRNTAQAHALVAIDLAALDESVEAHAHLQEAQGIVDALLAAEAPFAQETAMALQASRARVLERIGDPER